MADYIPAADAEFNAWQQNFVTYASARYMLRWVNTKGEKGPWGETATATVGV